MMLPVLLLAARVLVVDDTVVVPAGEWRAIELGLQQKPGLVECSFKELSRGSGVRATLMTMFNLRKLRDGSQYSILDTTPYLREGGFSYRVPRAGDYVLVIDNRFDGREQATVHLKVAIDFTERNILTPRYAPPRTRLVVIILSTLFFFAVCTYFAKRIAG